MSASGINYALLFPGHCSVNDIHKQRKYVSSNIAGEIERLGRSNLMHSL